jgi:hypothetical protein
VKTNVGNNTTDKMAGVTLWMEARQKKRVFRILSTKKK